MKGSILVLAFLLVGAVKASAMPQSAITDCLVLQTRWNDYNSKSRLAEESQREALAHAVTFVDQPAAERWYSQDNPDCCTYPDKLVYWKRYYEKEENEAYSRVEKIYHLITQRYLPYTSEELQRMYEYRRAEGYEGKKRLAWFDLPESHPDKKGGVTWLFAQTYPSTEIHDFCEIVMSYK